MRRAMTSGVGKQDFTLESLEPRRQFAADLAVSFSAMYAAYPSPIAAGDWLNTSVEVANLSSQAQIAGTGRFEYFLSSDRILDEQDILIRTYGYQNMAFVGHAPQSYSGDAQLPLTVPTGSYYVILKVTPSAVYADPDLSNNIAVTRAPINVYHRNADLAVSWDNAHFQLPAVLVPGDQLGSFFGGFNTPLRITNLTGQPDFVGEVRLDYYLSADTILDDRDTLMLSLPSESLILSGSNPRGYGPRTIVPTDIAPGSYYFIAKVTPVARFEDPNLGNNIAVSDNAISILRRFGNFSGRADVDALIRGADGHDVHFVQSDGGYGDVTVSPNGFEVTLNAVNNISNVTVYPDDNFSASPTSFDLASVTINGRLGFFQAPYGRLRGPLSATGSLGSLRLGDVAGPLTITIPSSSYAPYLSFANVREASIDSAVGISVVAKSWLDLDGIADTIRAPWISYLTITGNFYPSVSLSGAPPGYKTLGPVEISGVVKAGAWSVNGSVSPIHIYASTVNWSASFAGDVTSLTTYGSFRGVFTGRSIGSITSGRDLLSGRILAGAFLGRDGRLGGTGDDADSYVAGTIGSISVVHNIAGCRIGAGWNPVDGIFDNGNDRIEGGFAGSIGRITIGHIAGAQSRFIANYYGTTFPDPGDTITIGGIHVDWHHDRRFALATT